MQLDLTGILEAAARAGYEDYRARLLGSGVEAPAWEDLAPYSKMQMKTTLLPAVRAAAEEVKAQVRGELLIQLAGRLDSAHGGAADAYATATQIVEDL